MFERGLFLISMCILFVGCYRMPTDEDFSVVPVTNNKDIIKDKGNGNVPSALPEGVF